MDKIRIALFLGLLLCSSGCAARSPEAGRQGRAVEDVGPYKGRGKGTDCHDSVRTVSQ